MHEVDNCELIGKRKNVRQAGWELKVLRKYGFTLVGLIGLVSYVVFSDSISSFEYSLT